MIGATLRLLRLDSISAARAMRDVAAVSDLIMGAAPDRWLDLGPPWPALHYMLSFEAPMPRDVAIARDIEWDDGSIENVLMGGEATAYVDALSHARVVPAAAVAAFAAKLAAIAPQTFASRFDEEAAAMLPTDWSARDNPALDLAELFVRLVKHYQLAADAGDGLLIYAA